MNRRGRPLVSHEVIVNLIAATTTQKGLHVRAAIDDASYQKAIKVTDAEFTTIPRTNSTATGTMPSRRTPR
jgi:hypothetical protein